MFGISGARFLKWLRRGRFLQKLSTTAEKDTPGELETDSDPPEAARARPVREPGLDSPPPDSKNAGKSQTEQTENMDKEK